MVKQVIIIREDLNMSMGKAIAQGAHASLLALEDVDNIDIVNQWKRSGHTKIVLKVKNLNQLNNILTNILESNLPYSYIIDEGRTEFTEPTPTCIGIGPANSVDIDKITKKLRLF